MVVIGGTVVIGGGVVVVGGTVVTGEGVVTYMYNAKHSNLPAELNRLCIAITQGVKIQKQDSINTTKISLHMISLPGCSQED